MVTSLGPCCAATVVACSWPRSPNSDLISKVLGEQNSGPLRRTARKMQPQTDEQRGKRVCALTARGSIRKAMKGLVGGAAHGLSRLPQEMGHSPHPTELGHWNSSHQCGQRRGAHCVGRWKVQIGTECDEGTRPNQNRCRFAAAC